jgi:ribokinase
MARELAIIGNISLDRIRFAGAKGVSMPTLGGAALNIAAAFAFSGGKPRVYAHLGPNIAGLERYSTLIDLSGCERSDSDSPEFLLHYDAAHRLCGMEFDDEAVAAARLINIASRPPHEAFVHFSLRKPYGVADAIALCDVGFPVSLDVMLSSVATQSDGLSDLLPRLEAVFCNAQEWRELQSFVAVERMPLAIVTAGNAPIEVWRFGQVQSRHEVRPVPVVDPTGAGDAFCGGFLRGYLAGLDRSASVALGISTAERALSDFGVLHILDGIDARA